MRNAICKHCINPCKRSYVADCDKYEVTTIEQLESEKRKLYVDGTDPARLKEVIKKIGWFYYGLK